MKKTRADNFLSSDVVYQILTRAMFIQFTHRITFDPVGFIFVQPLQV